MIDGDALYPRADYGDATPAEKNRDTLRRLRLALRHEPAGTVVKLRCFSREEADWIREQLMPEERARVFFTWMEFRG